MDFRFGRRHAVPIESRGAAGGVAPLGLLERWYAAQPEPRIFCTAAELDEPLDLTRERLVAAMRDVASRHALLRASLLVGPEEEAPRPSCAAYACFGPRGGDPAPRFLVRSVEEFGRLEAELPVRVEAAGRAWPEAFAQLANAAFRDAGSAAAQRELLWKLLYLPPAPASPDASRDPGRGRGGSLLLVFHHVIGDGLSAASVTLELLEALARPAPAPAPAPPLDPLENKLDVRAQLGDIVRAFFLSDRKEAGYLGPPEPPVPVPRRPVHVPGRPGAALPALATPAPLVLERPSEPLARRCREAGVSVGAALSAAGLFALAAVAEEGDRPLPASLTTPVSLRGRAGVPPGAVGNYICGAATRHAVAPGTRFAGLAAGVRREIEADAPRAAREIGLVGIAGGRLPRLVLERCEAAGPSMRTSSLEVSNLGALPAPALPCALRFAQGVHYHGPLFALSAVTAAGRLSVTIAWPEPVLEAATGRRFAAAFDLALDTFLAAPAPAGPALAPAPGDFSFAEFLLLWRRTPGEIARRCQ
eukprot:tig00020610_g12045.t1